MNRTIKDATFKRNHYESHQQLEADHHDFINAYKLWTAAQNHQKA